MTNVKHTPLAAFLDEAAVYFERRDTGGEDMAFWANVRNGENCRRAAQFVRDADATIAEMKKALETLDGAAKAAVKENDQPNRVIFKDGFIVEGRAADEWLKFIRLITSVTGPALAGSQS